MASSGEQVRRTDCERVSRNLCSLFRVADGSGSLRSALRGDIVVHTFQSLLLFAFVSAVLEYGFKANLLSLFGGNAGRSE